MILGTLLCTAHCRYQLQCMSELECFEEAASSPQYCLYGPSLQQARNDSMKYVQALYDKASGKQDWSYQLEAQLATLQCVTADAQERMQDKQVCTQLCAY